MLRHNLAMKPQMRRGAVVLTLASLLLSPIASFAEPSPSPSPEVTRSPYEQFKIDRENYLDAMKIRSQQIKNINIVFKELCDKAARDYRAAMASARTPDQKNNVATARKNAISAAIVARDAAIAALGAEPVPPIDPAKPLKASNKKRQR